MSAAQDIQALVRAGRLPEAEKACRKLLSQHPRDPELLHGLAVLLMRQGQLDAALRPLNKALGEHPDHPVIANTKGVVLERLKRPAEAAECYRIALKTQNIPELWFNLGNACRHAKDDAGALEAYARAVALAPDRSTFLSALLGVKWRLCDWDGLDGYGAGLVSALTNGKDPIDPFRTLALDAPESFHQIVARRWAARFPAAQPVAGPAGPRERLTIGYLSADYQQHATAHLMAEFFELHDRGRFVINAYSLAPDDQSPMRKRLVAAFDAFVDCQGMTAQGVAQRIAADGVDILVDLKGYTRDSAPLVMVQRPAPIQVQWIGQPGTMGAPFMDYVLADRFVIPPGTLQFHDEAVVHLPHCYQVNDRKRPRPQAVLPRAHFGLPENGVVLACFNAPYKLRPGDFGLWMNLLRRNGEAVLWLYSDKGDCEDNLRAAAVSQGIDPARLYFARHADISEHLSRYHHVDVFMDTLPYNAHTTASDALWMGCPVVTRVGETFAGRVGESLLRAVRLDRLVTRTAQEYEDTILRLSLDPQERAAIRAHLDGNLLNLPLFDTPAATQAVERAYEMMWARAVAGQPPQTFAVP